MLVRDQIGAKRPPLPIEPDDPNPPVLRGGGDIHPDSSSARTISLIGFAWRCARDGDYKSAIEILGDAQELRPLDYEIARTKAHFQFVSGSKSSIQSTLGLTLALNLNETGKENIADAAKVIRVPEKFKLISTLIPSVRTLPEMRKYISWRIDDGHKSSPDWLESIKSVKRRNDEFNSFMLVASTFNDARDQLPYYLECLKIDPENAAANFQVGWYELGQKQYESAAKRFAIAMKTGKGDLYSAARQKHSTASQLAAAQKKKQNP